MSGRHFRTHVFVASGSSQSFDFLPANPYRLAATYLISGDCIIAHNDTEIAGGAGGYYLNHFLPQPVLQTAGTDVVRGLVFGNGTVVRIIEEYQDPGPPVTVTVTGLITLANGKPAAGYLTFTPGIVSWTATSWVGAAARIVVPLAADGSFTVTLQATDDPAINPSGWSYIVSECIQGRATATYAVAIPQALAPATTYSALRP